MLLKNEGFNQNNGTVEW